MTKDLMDLVLDTIANEFKANVDADGIGKRTGVDHDSAVIYARDPKTDVSALSKIFSDFKASSEVAHAVAQNPNTSSHTLRILFAFIPDEVRANPAFEQVEQEEKWATSGEFTSKKFWKGKSSTWNSYGISRSNPEIYRVPAYLEYGSAEDFRHIAGIEKVPNELLRPHLSGKNSHLRKALAARPFFEAADYEILAKDSAKSVRLTLAENPALSPSVFELLVADKDDDVRSAAMANPNCPPEVSHPAQMAEAMKPTAQNKPVGDLKQDEIIALLCDPSTTAERLDEIARSTEHFIRYACGMHANASPDLLRSLAADNQGWLAEAVAYNPNSPVELLEKLASDASRDLITALVSNPAIPEAVQLALAEQGTDRQKYILANTTNHMPVWEKLAEEADGKSKKQWQNHLVTALDLKTKAGTLYNMMRKSESRHEFVGRLAARHPKCPPSQTKILAYYCYNDLAHNPEFALQLLEDPGSIRAEPIRAWKLTDWASNNSLPGHIVNYYLSSDDELNRRRSAASDRASLRLLQPLVFSPDTKLRSVLAERRDLTRFMLEVLARDRNKRTRELVAKNKNCPAELLELLVADKAPTVKAAATQNPNFTQASKKPGEAEQFRNRGPVKDRLKMAKEARKIELLTDLAQDEDAQVRREVAENSKTKGDLLVGLLQDEDAEVRLAALRNDALPLDLIPGMLDDSYHRVRNTAYRMALYLSKGEKRDELALQALEDSDVYVRALGANYIRDVSLQHQLAAEGEDSIDRELSKNEHLDLSTAKLLMKSTSRQVRQRILWEIDDLDIVRQGLEDSDSSVRDAATDNPSFLRHAEEFINHPSAEARIGLARRFSKLPAAVSRVLEEDPNENVQYEISEAKRSRED